MKSVAQLPYYKVQREIRDGQQRNITSDRKMVLYDDRIVTKFREFPIHEVFDMSYRSMGNEGGVFYLHTNKGVYPYLIACDPEKFIEAYKEQEKKRKEIETSD